MMPAFHRDAYLTTLDTRIINTGISKGREWAVLDDTIIYPEGGGQPADTGTINGIAVSDVITVDGVIRHLLESPVEPGPAHLELDWPRRWDHMQQHTAQHLLTAIADTSFGWPTTAFHLGKDVSDVELATDSLSHEDLAALEDAVTTEIRASRKVAARIVEEDELGDLDIRSRGLPEGHIASLRLVEIDGLDLNTCGGTHLRSTAEIGSLNLIGAERLRGGTRLFFVAGDRARQRMHEHEQRNLQLRILLGVPDDEIVKALKARLEKEKISARTNRLLLDDLAEAEFRNLSSASTTLVTAHWPNRDMGFLSNIARKLANESQLCTALLTAGSENEGVYIIIVPEDFKDKAPSLVDEITAIIGGRGGGRNRLFQGKATLLQRRDEATVFFESML